MEREITLILTNCNDKKVINSQATTLGELKAEMTALGISHEGMDFMEGLSKTTMINDDSVLPTDVPWHGSTTNNLVFMVTNSKKKLSQGEMSRKECYEFIKTQSLNEEVHKAFGKHYTNVATEKLINFIESYKLESELKFRDRSEVYAYIKKENLQEAIKLAFGKSYTNIPTHELIGFIYDFSYHCGAVVKKSSYSDAEINEMFKDML